MCANPKQAGSRRFFVAALAVCVFVLAMQAKLSLYDSPHPGSISPAAASKLWVSGDKLKAAAAGVLPVLWLTALLLYLPPEPRMLRSESGRTPVPRYFELREAYRFLRPPPVS